LIVTFPTEKSERRWTFVTKKKKKKKKKKTVRKFDSFFHFFFPFPFFLSLLQWNCLQKRERRESLQRQEIEKKGRRKTRRIQQRREKWFGEDDFLEDLAGVMTFSIFRRRTFARSLLEARGSGLMKRKTRRRTRSQRFAIFGGSSLRRTSSLCVCGAASPDFSQDWAWGQGQGWREEDAAGAAAACWTEGRA